MLFTVFQYVPILEEETPGHRVELTKKAKQNDLEGGDSDCTGDDMDNDDDSQEDYNYYFYENFGSFQTLTKPFYTSTDSFYKYLLEQKDTPPPKV
ncbi:hypothetical protein [Aurantibacillus circumpalustris]|uniref:hypothetical protein n=1 Tax=Aurantibacillus circumpalustris TaxID=3036359 RepID=UPI00295C268E|nr:hypothetical protein [Aurantibacillus circumpalustris]